MKPTDHIARNIDLAFRFLGEAADDPAILDKIDGGRTLVLFPSDVRPDPELSVANAQLARRLADAGYNVTTWAVETATPGGPGVLGRWPVLPPGKGPVVTYDRDRDVLEIDLLTTDRPTLPVRSAPPAVLHVDPETGIIVGVTVPRFIAEAAPKSLLLFDLLLRPTARLHGVTPHDLQAIRNALAHGRAAAGREPVTTEEIAGELARLSA